MSLFEDFVSIELPQRAVMLTDANTGGYVGNPNSAVLDKIRFAPKGTWFIDALTGDLWQKLLQSDPSSWVSRGAGGSSEVAARTNIPLIGIKDGNNRVFTTPEKFRNIGGRTIQVYHNGRRLVLGGAIPASGDFYASESVPGTGYDTITLTTFSPVSRSTLYADYLAILV